MMLKNENFPKNPPLSPEILVPRLGESLLEAGKISKQQLNQALRYQNEQKEGGKHLRLGEALRDLGFIDDESLEEVITLQILQLQDALRQANQELERRVEERTRDLQVALDQVSELSQVKSKFIANVSHELRTPLNLLKGYLHVLGDEGFGPITAEQAVAIKTMQSSEERLEKLIEDLILLSYSERGQLILELAPTDITELLESIIQNACYKAQLAKVVIKVKCPPDMPKVVCDPHKISWVIGELVNNAIKFTPKGGLVYVDATCSGKMVKIAVTDTGIGIPIQRETEIFEPFHQLDESSTRKYGGTGLGLALCNRIVTAHGSSIQVHSKAGKGSRFEFCLEVEPH